MHKAVACTISSQEKTRAGFLTLITFRNVKGCEDEKKYEWQRKHFLEYREVKNYTKRLALFFFVYLYQLHVWSRLDVNFTLAKVTAGKLM